MTCQRQKPPSVSRTKLHILLAEQLALGLQDTVSLDKENADLYRVSGSAEFKD